jgi:hypothetical protein
VVHAAMELTKVQLFDPNATAIELISWARKHCVSYSLSIETDVSDVSLSIDIIYEFWFGDPKDATLFTLRWS